MKKINSKELKEIVKAHELWLRSRSQRGRKADLSNTDLYGVILPKAKLIAVNLIGVNLTGADLSGADLSFADLSGANLTRTRLCWTILLGVNLSGADLSGATLHHADLRWNNLSRTNLKVATAKDCWIKGAKFSSPEDRARLLMLGAIEREE